MKHLALVFVAFALGAIAVPALGQIPNPTMNSTVFVSDRLEGNNWDVYYMPDVDFPAIVYRLTTNIAIDNHPDLYIADPVANSKIVWSSNRDGDFEIYIASPFNVEGTLQQLTFNSYPDRHPHFSHNGERIVFDAKYREVSTPADTIRSECSVPVPPPYWYEGLCVYTLSSGTLDLLDLRNMPINGGPETWPSTFETWVGHPSFSPDGTKILFSAALDAGGTSWEVYSMDYTPISNLRRHTYGSVYPPNPNPIRMSAGAHYSEDGTWIYYSSTRTTLGNSQLFRINSMSLNVATSAPFQLTTHYGNDYVPEPMEDGRVLFVSDLGPNICAPPDEGASMDLDIFIMNDDGTGRINLTDNDLNDEMLLIGDEVSWFCGIKPNLSECTKYPKYWNICWFKIFYQMGTDATYLPNFPKRNLYTRAWSTVSNYMQAHNPMEFQRIVLAMFENWSTCETSNWQDVPSWWVLPSIFGRYPDLQMVGISSPAPSSSFPVGTSITPEVNVRNNGSTPETGTVVVRIRDPFDTEIYAGLVADLIPIDQISFSLTPTSPIMVPGRYSVSVEIQFADDMVPGNNMVESFFDIFDCVTLALNPLTLPIGTTGIAYSQALTASGGTEPYVYTVTDGSLPAGFFDPGSEPFDGVIWGTPTTPGNYNFTITVTDANDCTVSQNYDLEILPTSEECERWTSYYNNPLTNGNENMGFAIGTIAKKLHRGLALDAAGNAYVCGYSEGVDTSRSLLGKLILTKTKYDVRVVKYDVNGAVVWVGRYNDPALNKDEFGYAICVDDEGNAYVAGSKDNGATKIDALVVKFNAADGSVDWATTYDGGLGGKKEYAYGIAIDPAGEYLYVAGETDQVASKTDGLALCLEAAGGDIVWEDLYNSPSIANAKDYFYDVACDANGDAVMTGMSEGQYTVGSKAFKTKFDVPVIKYAGGGGSVSRVWEKRYNNSDSIKFVPKNGNDIGYDVEIDSYGNVYVAGCTEWVFKFDMLALKYDPAGNLIARGRYNNYPAGAIAKGGNDIGYSIGYDGSGNMYVAGASEGGYWDGLKFISTKNDMALIKFAGTNSPAADTAHVLWSRLYDSGVLPKGTDDIAVDLAVCETGNMVWVTGWGDRGVGFKKDIITLQYSLSGIAGPVGIKNGSNLKDDFGYNVAVRPQTCCAVVAGVVDSKLPRPAIATKLDFITMQGPAGTALGGPVTAPGAYEGDEIVAVPSAFTLYDNYPNPFNPSTTIRMMLNTPSMVSLKVYNVLGQEVAALLDKQEFDAGEQEVVFDAHNLASGVYFYRVTSETITEDGLLGETFMSVKKMLLIK